MNPSAVRTRFLVLACQLSLLLGCDSAPPDGPPPRFQVEELGAPVVTMESASFTAYNRAGVAHHLLFFHPMRRPIDCQVRILDTATGTVKEASGPPDRPLRMVELDGKYYLGQYGEVAVWVYDPETMSIEYKKGPDLGRLIAFSMIVGPDRKIYMGTASADCRLVQYDPATGTFRDYGTQGPEVKGPRYAHAIATDGRFVYTASGKNPWYLVARDLNTGAQQVLLKDNIKYLSVHSGHGWASARVTFEGSEASYLLRHGAMADATPYTHIEAGREGAMVAARAGALEYFDASGQPATPMPLPSPTNTVSALSVRADGEIIFALAGGNGLYAVSPANRQTETFATVGSAGSSLTQIVAEGDWLYVVTSSGTPFAVHRRSGKQNELPCGGDIERIRGKLYASERGVTIPRGNSIVVPARFRLEDGAAVRDLTCAAYDLKHRYWTSPDVILDTMQPDGRFAIHWRALGGDDWRKTTARIEALPVKIETLHALPDGRLWGNTRRYQECFLYDPRNGKFEVLPGKFPLSGPCVETLVGRVFMAGYPGGTFLEYDPAKEWTLGDDPTKRKPPIDSPDSNPRLAFQFSRLGDESPSHHVVASVVGADGNFYLGGHCERNAVGGGIGWWDVKTGKPGSLRKPFLVYDCAGLAAAYDGAKLVYSSRVAVDPAGKIPTPPEAKLFVFDIATKSVTAEHVPFAGAKSTGAVLARDHLVHGFAQVDSVWTHYVFDLNAGKVVSQSPLPGTPHRPRWGPDGNIWLFVGTALTRLDPKSGQFETLGEVTESGEMIFVGNDLYLTGDPQLRRIRDAVNLKQ